MNSAKNKQRDLPSVISGNDYKKRKLEVEESSYYWKKKPIVKKRKSRHFKKYKIVELFCGCGGTSRGFEMAGFDVILGVDIHKPSADTFHKNHKKATTIIGDLSTISEDFLFTFLNGTDVHVLIAGVPCQGFSLNNRKRHEFDKRNFLFIEYLRYVKKISPPVAILENVSGMKSTANGQFIEEITNKFKQAGYANVDNRLLNAADYGVPQIRKRLVFVATKKGLDFNWPVKTHGTETKESYVSVKEAISDLPLIAAGELSDAYIKKPKTDYQKEMRKNATILENHIAPKHPNDTIKKVASTEPGQPMYPRFKQRIRLHWNKPSPTQVSGGIRPQFQFGHPECARGLTVRERCRIQSFPDDFVILGGTVQGRVQTGNAVPPLLAKAIAKEVRKIL